MPTHSNLPIALHLLENVANNSSEL